MKYLKPTVTERRKKTRGDIYRYILTSPEAVTKQDVSYTLGVSMPTVHQNIAELMEAGLIRIGQKQQSTGGRPASGYVAVEDAVIALGAAITNNHIRILATDLRQHILAQSSERVKTTDDPHLEKRVRAQVSNFIKKNKLDESKILGLGLTVPGVIDQERDVVVLSPTMKMRNLSISSIRKELPWKLHIDNDATCAGLAEWIGNRYNTNKDKDTFVCIHLENGVGGAIVTDGRAYLGDHVRSAEFGHMCVVPGGRLCSCGKKGCLEAYCSAKRLTADLGITAEEFFEGLEKGNKKYAKLWDEMLTYLAVGIHNIRMVMDSDIVLGGILSSHLEPYLPQIYEAVREMDPFENGDDYLTLARYPDEGVMLGAAWYFIDEFVRGL